MNNIIFPKKKTLTQRFVKKDLEDEFNIYSSKMMTQNHRIGMYLSIISWIAASFTLYIAFPGEFGNIFKFIFILIPIFISVIIVSKLENRHNLSQLLAAITNMSVALLIIYISVKLKSQLVFIVGLIITIFFSSCILKIRFWFNLWLTLLEIIIAQLILKLNLEVVELNAVISIFALWIGWLCSTFASYFLENSDRKLFIFQKYLEDLNEKLRQESFIDPLTRLYNRQYFFEALKAEMYTSERFNKPLCVAMIDIDFFKKVNDGLGHPVGDTVLIQFCKILKDCFRESDITARYGGEEFVVFLKETNLEQALIGVNRFLEMVRTFDFPSVPWNITSSCGLVQLTDEVESLDLIKKADDKLYMSKRSGRDKVTI